MLAGITIWISFESSFYSLKITSRDVVKAQRTMSLIVTPSFFEADLISSSLIGYTDVIFITPDISLLSFFLVMQFISYLANNVVLKIFGI
jgi:hypothetical protein